MLRVYDKRLELAQVTMEIPTNGDYRLDGRAVMGAGVAFVAVQQFPNLPILLGAKLRASGNHAIYWHEFAHELPTTEAWTRPLTAHRHAHDRLGFSPAIPPALCTCERTTADQPIALVFRFRNVYNTIIHTHPSEGARCVPIL